MFLDSFPLRSLPPRPGVVLASPRRFSGQLRRSRPLPGWSPSSRIQQVAKSFCAEFRKLNSQGVCVPPPPGDRHEWPCRQASAPPTLKLSSPTWLATALPDVSLSASPPFGGVVSMLDALPDGDEVGQPAFWKRPWGRPLAGAAGAAALPTGIASTVNQRPTPLVCQSGLSVPLQDGAGVGDSDAGFCRFRQEAGDGATRPGLGPQPAWIPNGRTWCYGFSYQRPSPSSCVTTQRSGPIARFPAMAGPRMNGCTGPATAAAHRLGALAWPGALPADGRKPCAAAVRRWHWQADPAQACESRRLP